MIPIYFYDCEVFKYDWLVVIGIPQKDTLRYYHFWNEDADKLKEFLEEHYTVYAGFNCKHYDYFIVKAMCAAFSPEEVKEVNDFIIGGGQGWDYEPLKKLGYFDFPQCDLMDDVQQGLSLKSIEGHLGMDIRESTVPWDIDRPLTQEEREETLKYCKHDVLSTYELYKLRKNYLQTKINVGKLAEITDREALAMTNAKLTAKLLKAVRKDYSDERDYKYPNNLLREYISQEVFDFFDRLLDKSIPDDEVFGSNMSLSIGDCEVTIGFGGIHGCIPNYTFKEADDRVLRNFDVGAYYPHLIVYYDYASRSIPSPDTYKEVLETRMKAKAEGDKETSNALKLVSNTTYGCLLNQYNDLYDPLMGRSVCITGQLFLLELAQQLYMNIYGLKIIQVNTDGVMFEYDSEYQSEVMQIIDDWQYRTRFTLEEDKLSFIVQKDVNNYIAKFEDGSVKTKGGYLVRGVSQAGAFNVNNNARIVSKAIIDYFLKDTPPEDTINNCNDPFEFQIIAKASSKYSRVYQIVCDKEEPVQKCNRVFAVANENYGTLYKVKKENGQVAKIADLPEHCLIDNSASIYPEMIDKNYYIQKAWKQINDFKGDAMATEKEETKKPKTVKKTDNIYSRLLQARSLFHNECIKKSGKNFNIGYHYFELTDIVPVALPIFEKVGIIPIVTFSDYVARLTMVNVDNPEDVVEFCSPMREPEAIVSKAGKEVTNAVQRIGSAQTYLRRYLYLIALDIVESDGIEEKTGEGEAPKKPAYVSQEVREQTKQELTNTEDMATELQIKQLKRSFKQLVEKDDNFKVEVTDFANQTENFKKMTKKVCEEKIKWVTEKLKEVDDGSNKDNTPQ